MQGALSYKLQLLHDDDVTAVAAEHSAFAGSAQEGTVHDKRVSSSSSSILSKAANMVASAVKRISADAKVLVLAKIVVRQVK